MEVGVLKSAKDILKSGLLLKIPEEKQFIYIRSIQRMHQLNNELRNFDKLSDNILKMKLKQYHNCFVVVEEINKSLK